MWIEPVRDWNGFFISKARSLIICVNWTCEGLKQVWPTNSTFLFLSVNWTCEGLKPWKNWWDYKDLQKVWIEPVRDWNHSWSWVKQHITVACELNLWGIETKGEGVMEVDIDIIVIVKIIVILLLLIARYFRDLGSRWNCVWIEPVRDWNA